MDFTKHGSIAKFARLHNLPRIDVVRHLKEGKCRWPKKQNNTTQHPLYKTYMGIKQRCYNVNHMSYKNYGARGITMSGEWYVNFWKFVEDMGERPGPEYSIDRIDNDGPYSKENCRWATSKQQRNNQRPAQKKKSYTKQDVKEIVLQVIKCDDFNYSVKSGSITLELPLELQETAEDRSFWSNR